MTRIVKILSGIPGCGKSTYAKRLDHENEFGPPVHVVSADKFFLNDDEEYNFDQSKIGEAHASCMHEFLSWLQMTFAEKRDCIIVVDNTNIHAWERRNYELAATLMGWDVELHFWTIKDMGDIRICARRQIHGVPLEIVLRMAFEQEVAYGENCFFHRVEN